MSACLSICILVLVQCQAIGAILKPEKSSVYFMFYKFVNGRARLKKRSEFPPAIAEVTTKDGKTAPAHITIPQPDGSKVPIKTHEDVRAALRPLRLLIHSH